MNWLKPRTHRKVLDKLKHSALNGEDFRNIMELADQLYQEKACTETHYDLYDQLNWYIQTLDFSEQQSLMCMMYLGRNIDYDGYTIGTTNTYLRHMSETHFGHIRGQQCAEYVAGKRPLGKWLHNVAALTGGDVNMIGGEY